YVRAVGVYIVAQPARAGRLAPGACGRVARAPVWGAPSTSMRFVFVDRIVAAEPLLRIDTLKNVSATEDVFADHFPGYPVFPGALVVEAFAQACELLIAMSHDFAE